MNKDYNKTLTSFSGADLSVAFGKKVIAELQSISWAVQRRKAPIYTLGSADVRSFSRGVRGIAGALVFAEFDRDALIEEMKSVWSDIAPEAMFTAAGNLYNVNNNNFADALNKSGWNGVEDKLEDVRSNEQWNQMGTDAFNQTGTPAGFARIQKDNVLYADTLPPFDVTMTFANEYGQTAFRKIYDLDILNESSGVSVDSVVMERQVTWIARRISPMIRGTYSREISK